MNNPADVPFLLEGKIHDDVYVLPLLIQGNDFVSVCVVNLSDVPVCLRRHILLAKAVEVDAMLDPHGGIQEMGLRVQLFMCMEMTLMGTLMLSYPRFAVWDRWKMGLKYSFSVLSHRMVHWTHRWR